MAKKEKERGRCALDLPRVSYLRAAEEGGKGPDKIKINQKRGGGFRISPAPTWPRPQQKRKRGQGHQQPHQHALKLKISRGHCAPSRRTSAARVAGVCRGCEGAADRPRVSKKMGEGGKGEGGGPHLGRRERGGRQQQKRGGGKKNYSIRTSHVLTNRTTNRTRTCLTSLSGREAVLSG